MEDIQKSINVKLIGDGQLQLTQKQSELMFNTWRFHTCGQRIWSSTIFQETRFVYESNRTKPKPLSTKCKTRLKTSETFFRFQFWHPQNRDPSAVPWARLKNCKKD